MGGSVMIETANVELGQAATRSHATVPAGSYVRLVVADTGTGMDAATRDRIFEPFFSTKPKEKGTGLGLSVVYGIVNQSSGHVSVFSEVGKARCLRFICRV